MIAMPESTADIRLPWQVRRYRRFKMRFPVDLVIRCGDQTSEIEAVSRDVCIGGVLLECPLPVPPQSTVNFVISLQAPTLRPVRLVGDGKVVRVEPTKVPGEFAIALECAKPIAEIETYFPSDSN